MCFAEPDSYKQGRIACEFVKVGSNPGRRDNEVMGFRIPRGGSKVKIRATNMDFRKANFHLFRYLFGKIPKDTVLVKRGTHNSCCVFKNPP